MRQGLGILFVLCCMSFDLFAQGEQLVKLKNLQLDISGLILEASRQTGIEVVCEVQDTSSIKVYYDCVSSFNQVLQAISGYFKVTRDIDLELIWKDNKVYLRPIHQKIESVRSQVTEEKKASVNDKETSTINLWSWLRAKLPKDKNSSRRLDIEEKEVVGIKKMDLTDEEDQNKVIQEDISSVDALPSRLQVEVVPNQVKEDLSDLDIITMPIQKELVKDLNELTSQELPVTEVTVTSSESTPKEPVLPESTQTPITPLESSEVALKRVAVLVDDKVTPSSNVDGSDKEIVVVAPHAELKAPSNNDSSNIQTAGNLVMAPAMSKPIGTTTTKASAIPTPVEVLPDL